MSLDVYLHNPTAIASMHCDSCTCTHQELLYDANITHNLNRMAGEAGIYEALWRPEEIGIKKASQLIEPLEKGLQLMKQDPTRFKAFDAPNGWGIYEHFIPFVEKYLAACREFPDAEVSASR